MADSLAEAPEGAVVAIAGPTNLAWVVCDLAVARSGMVPVGVHLNGDDRRAAAELAVCGASVLCVPWDLMHAREGQWTVPGALKRVGAVVRTVVFVDASAEKIRGGCSELQQRCVGLLDMVAADEDRPLPDPFECGAPYARADGRCPARLGTFAMTAGVEGEPVDCTALEMGGSSAP